MNITYKLVDGVEDWDVEHKDANVVEVRVSLPGRTGLEVTWEHDDGWDVLFKDRDANLSVVHLFTIPLVSSVLDIDVGGGPNLSVRVLYSEGAFQARCRNGSTRGCTVAFPFDRPPFPKELESLGPSQLRKYLPPRQNTEWERITQRTAWDRLSREDA